jgi:hypothetical protein
MNAWRVLAQARANSLDTDLTPHRVGAPPKLFRSPVGSALHLDMDERGQLMKLFRPTLVFVEGLLATMRREWNIECQREAIALRTVLAYPEGTTPFLQERAVLDGVIDAYPAVWLRAVDLNRVSRDAGRSYSLCRKSLLIDRVPLRLFRIFVLLGRQDITESQALSELEKFFNKD